MNTNIVPSIKEIEQQEKTVLLDGYFLTDAYETLVEAARETLTEFGVNARGSKPIVEKEIPGFADGEYTIEIAEDAISVGHSGFRGAFYGIVTLCQLARLNHNRLNLCKIHDYPDMKVRSLSDDISRGQVSSMENFKSILRRLSYWKYNEYFPYIEDTFNYAFLPSEKTDYALTGAEWKEICQYGRKYGITVRPLVNLLSHFKSAGQKGYYPYVLHTKEGGTMGCIDPLAPGVKDFVGKMLDEVVDAFGEGEFHCGCDEVDALTNVYGKQEAEVIYCDYVNFLNAELKKRNCSMMIYGDMFYVAWGDYAYGLDALKRLDKDITLVYWAYQSAEEYPYVKTLTAPDRKLFISPAARSFNRFMPAYITYENMRKICNYSIGIVDSVIISSWNDNGAILREENMVAFCIGSEFSWASHSERSFEDLLDAFVRGYFAMENVDMSYFYDVYHYEPYVTEEAVNRACEVSTFICKEFFKGITQPTATKFDLHLIAKKLIDVFSKALDYVSTLKPAANADTYECFIFDIKRMLWALKRADLIPDAETPKEEIAALVKAHPEMLAEYKALHAENEKLWMKFSRRSEWARLDRLYAGVENSFEEITVR